MGHVHILSLEIGTHQVKIRTVHYNERSGCLSLFSSVALPVLPVAGTVEPRAWARGRDTRCLEHRVNEGLTRGFEGREG